MLNVTEKMNILNTFISSSDAPIQTVALADKLGIKVYHAAWPVDISGKIQKDSSLGGTSGFAIFVNKDHHVNRRRFTTAHEISHYVLHEDQIGDGIFDDALYRSGLPNSVEAQANGMAADILMPWSILNRYIPLNIQGGAVNVAELAKIFQISPESMRIRLGQPT